MTRKLKHGHQAPDYSLNDNRETQTFVEKPSGSNPGLKAILSKVKRSEANVELEGGETVLGDITGGGEMQHGKVVGKSHKQGGVPLKLPQGTFIFSNSDDLRITDPEALELFGVKDKSGKGITPAEIAKKFEINKFQEITKDNNNNHFSKKTADLMLQKNLQNLLSLAAIQEGMKDQAAPKSKKVRYKLPEFEEGGSVGGVDNYNKGRSSGGHLGHVGEEYDHFNDYKEAVKMLISKGVDVSDVDKSSPDKMWKSISQKLLQYSNANGKTLAPEELKRVDYLRRSVFKGATGIKKGLDPKNKTESTELFAQEVIDNKPDYFLSKGYKTAVEKEIRLESTNNKANLIKYNIGEKQNIDIQEGETAADLWSSLITEMPDATRVANNIEIPTDAKIGRDSNGNYVAVDAQGNLIDVLGNKSFDLASIPEFKALQDKTRVADQNREALYPQFNTDQNEAMPAQGVVYEKPDLSSQNGQPDTSAAPDNTRTTNQASSLWGTEFKTNLPGTQPAPAIRENADPAPNTPVVPKPTPKPMLSPAGLTQAQIDGRSAADEYSRKRSVEQSTAGTQVSAQTAPEVVTAQTAPEVVTAPEQDVPNEAPVKDGSSLEADVPASETLADAPVKANEGSPWWAQDMIALAGALTDGVNRYDPAMQQVPIETMRSRRVSADGRIAARQSAGESTMDVIENTSDGQVARANALGVSAQVAEGASQDQAQVDSMNASVETQISGQNAQLVNQGRVMNAQLRDDYNTKSATVSQNFDNAQRMLKQRRLKALMNGMTNADNTKMLNDLYPNVSVDPRTGQVSQDKSRDLNDPTYKDSNTSEALNSAYIKAYQEAIGNNLSESAAEKAASLAVTGTMATDKDSRTADQKQFEEFVKSLQTNQNSGR